MSYEERTMTKTEHLQFLVLMIPTFVILVAAAASMADLAIPAPSSELYVVATNTQGGQEE
jgi:hypothetical protein